MAAARAVIALDTNLLVYGHRAGVPEHRAARRAIEGAAGDARGVGIALPSVAEFWSVVTHPQCVGGPSRPAQAEAYLSMLRDQLGVLVFLPVQGAAERLGRIAESLGLAGARIFDLQIALVAWEAGATELWTHDRRFVSVPGLRVHHPL